jgi:hypothetical protein
MFATKTRLIAAAALSTALFAGAARAGDVNWSIGIQAPIGPGASIGTVFSNRYVSSVIVAPAPVVYAPAPVVYGPPRVVYEPAPVVYEPAPVYYAPPPVYVTRRVAYAPVWVGDRWSHRHHRHHRDGWRDQWRDDRGHWDRDDRRGPPVRQPQGGRYDPR